MNPDKFTTIFIILILLLFAFMVWFFKVPEAPPAKYAPMKWIEEHHAYHGVDGSVCDMDTGVCTFKRGGKN